MKTDAEDLGCAASRSRRQRSLAHGAWRGRDSEAVGRAEDGDVGALHDELDVLGAAEELGGGDDVVDALDAGAGDAEVDMDVEGDGQRRQRRRRAGELLCTAAVNSVRKRHQ